MLLKNDLRTIPSVEMDYENYHRDNNRRAFFAALLKLGIVIAAIALGLAWLAGCQHTVIHPTPGQVATTRPANHPLANINQVLYHSQKVLEGVNILALIVALAGCGVMAYGFFTANSIDERFGMIVGLVAGAIAIGTFAGILILPFAPWAILAIFVAGASWGGFKIYAKYFRKKPAPIAEPGVTFSGYSATTETCPNGSTGSPTNSSSSGTPSVSSSSNGTIVELPKPA